MLFNSFEFIFAFLPITFFIYFYLNKKRLTDVSKGFLVFSSLLFYSWWNIAYLPIILSSMLFNYLIGSTLAKNKDKGGAIKTKRLSRKKLLIIGIVANLALLGYFKYTDFLVENINFALDSSIPLVDLALPLAISFFTFQQIAYLVDSYRRETHEYDFLNYAIFVTFFPQLIAGPIVHHKEMMPQFANIKTKVINYRNIALGLFIFSIGLFKKVAIADTFSVWAIAGFDNSSTLSFFEAWATSLSYTFQLYFDFSGYTDMAIGLALLFNIKLPINFNSPYKATNIQDFWRRWHITLSRFLKDYIYIPLGGNRHSNFRTYTNLMATFIIGGIWHGAGWTFIFWGLLHGLALVIHRLWSTLNIKLWTWLAWLITFNFINIAWVFFRATSWSDAKNIIAGMFNLQHIVISKPFATLVNFLNPLVDYFDKFKGSNFTNGLTIYTLEMIIIGFIFISAKNSNEYYRAHAHSRMFAISHSLRMIMALGISLILMSLQTGSEFLYFNF